MEGIMGGRFTSEYSKTGIRRRMGTASAMQRVRKVYRSELARMTFSDNTRTHLD